MEYREYLGSEEWKKKRGEKLKNKKNCSICWSCDNIDIHHLTYKNIFNEPTTDLRRLCRSCHQLTHKLFNEWKIKFTSDSHHSRFAIIKYQVKKYLWISSKNMFI